LLHADIYGLPAARRAGIRHAISSRHNDDSFRHNPILKWINQWAMQCADQVIGISHALSRFVHEVEGIAEERIVTVHYGLEAPPLNPEARASARAELHYDDDVAVVGLFGRLIRQKGVDVLLDAYQLVLRAHSNTRLLVAGDGPARSALERQARRLHLDEVVRFVGWIDGARRLMSCCDVIAVPSRWEGFGLVTLEAMSCALPIVASQVSALPEIVLDGETGLLVPPEEPRPLADALLSLFGSPARAAAMGRAGYERLVTSFSVEKMVRATIDVYERVADAGE
jgi:glycosyltransferase involved in cell wall biosynthesis